jgi:hypothetical protein
LKIVKTKTQWVLSFIGIQEQNQRFVVNYINIGNNTYFNTRLGVVEFEKWKYLSNN